jgi:hypothetical protein
MKEKPRQASASCIDVSRNALPASRFSCPLQIVVLATLGAIGAAPIPSAGLVIVVTIWNQVWNIGILLHSIDSLHAIVCSCMHPCKTTDFSWHSRSGPVRVYSSDRLAAGSMPDVR